MKISEIISVLQAKVHYLAKDNEITDIKSAAASDLMSDILARTEIPDILLTGLNNMQVIRTSSVFGIKAVIIVRNRPMEPKLIELAKEEDITLLSTKNGLFQASGKLYEKGITGK